MSRGLLKVAHHNKGGMIVLNQPFKVLEYKKMAKLSLVIQIPNKKYEFFIQNERFNSF